MFWKRSFGETACCDALVGGAGDLGQGRLPEGPGFAGGFLDLLRLGRVGDDQQAGDHPGQGRVETGLHRRDHGHDPGGEIGGGSPDPEPGEKRDQRQRSDADRDRDRVQRLRIEDADHRDRDDVIDDRQGQQEDPQLGRELRPDDRQGPEQEGGVGGDHDAPAVFVARTGVDREEDRGRQQHAADAGEHRRR